MTLGERLRFLREQRGITQEELARAIGLTKQAISKYEADERVPGPDILVKIADYFMVTIDFLLGHSVMNTMYV